MNLEDNLAFVLKMSKQERTHHGKIFVIFVKGQGHTSLWDGRWAGISYFLRLRAHSTKWRPAFSGSLMQAVFARSLWLGFSIKPAVKPGCGIGVDGGPFLSPSGERRRGERREVEGAPKVLRWKDPIGVLAEGGGGDGAASGTLATGRRRQHRLPPLLELPRVPLLRVRPHRPLLQRSRALVLSTPPCPPSLLKQMILVQCYLKRIICSYIQFILEEMYLMMISFDLVWVALLVFSGSVQISVPKRTDLSRNWTAWIICPILCRFV
jgi:hypothetical protein